MYSQSVETSFGELAKKFLSAKRSVQGLQGFINSDLAEPYMAQDSMSSRTEIIDRSVVKDKSEAHKIMWIDCQAVAPFFWYVIRAWSAGGNSEAIEVGNANTWEQLEARQKANKVKNTGVFVDSGFGAKADAEVYLNCALRSEFREDPHTGRKIAVGWNPAKGTPSERRWKNDDDVEVAYTMVAKDPFHGTDKEGRCVMYLFEAASGFYKDILANLRARRGGVDWAVSSKMCHNIDISEYWRHLDGQIKREVYGRNGQAQHRWEKRHRHWPDHLHACETGQVAAASFFGLFPLELEGKEKK